MASPAVCFCSLLLLLLLHLPSSYAFLNGTDGSILHGIVLPEDPTAPVSDCLLRSEVPTTQNQKPIKLRLLHRDQRRVDQAPKGLRRIDSLLESCYRDVSRIRTFHDRIDAKRPRSRDPRSASGESLHRQLDGHGHRGRLLTQSRKEAGHGAGRPEPGRSRVVATLESGVSVGSGEYLMDVYVGTPPRHFSLIVDTGSDLNWLQCLPCRDCYPQESPHYDPAQSSSFRTVSCKDSVCMQVSSPDTSRPRCQSENGTCDYFYWYGDRSNTTGDLATETFTVNVSSTPDGGLGSVFRLEKLVFGCGHWNRGLFHGAGGLLGLGRGELSFLSQLQSTYGRKFSYCLVDRESDPSVSGRLVLGEDDGLVRHPNVQFTELVPVKESPVDTFYYVRIKAVRVGGEVLRIPPETFQIGPDGSGGTIVDSGTTLTYFPEPAMAEIKAAFLRKVKGLDRVSGFKQLDLCFNVTGADRVELPEFSILFMDGAVWSFPAENYFIRLDPEGVICLALLGTPMSSLSILGNYQQQNFHVLYDLDKSRIGFAPEKCAEV
ncbi:aspartyl protease family protein 2-like [Nymphaea colorata]|uniref:Peptidase A1 domain-containing protein n=1 Tax=Nymphaea colorata TaxID=210225 RepID=A0A5K0ZT74_9MAGN|nr:aspartyl protease family protein 2-like [Nymphaea colorata]